VTVHRRADAPRYGVTSAQTTYPVNVQLPEPLTLVAEETQPVGGVPLGELLYRWNAELLTNAPPPVARSFASQVAVALLSVALPTGIAAAVRT
jgi:hypothetical protein